MFVTSFYLVRDKLCFSWTRWMSYGLCSLAGGMWNPKPRNLWRITKSWRYYEGDLEGIWRRFGRNMKIKMAEVLSKKFPNSWRFSKIDGENLSWKVSKPTYFQKIWWRCLQSQMDQYQFQEEYTSHIIERMKLANPNRSKIIPSQGG